MRHRLIMTIAAALALSAAGAANAAEPRVLKTGDQLETQVEGGLAVHQARAALRAYGYGGFSKGRIFGRIIEITAYAPNKFQYRLRVDNQTHIITRVIRVRTAFP